MTNYTKKEKAVAITTIFKMKMRRNVERIKEEHLQDTCEAKMIFERDVYEEDEEIHMGDSEQAPPKFEDTQSHVQDPMEEVNLDTMEESRIIYISSLLPSDLKKGIITIL